MHFKYKPFSLQSISLTTDKSQTCQDGLALSRVRFTLQLKYYCSFLSGFPGLQIELRSGRILYRWLVVILPPFQSKSGALQI